MKSEISALIDDELATDAAGRTIDALRQNIDLRREWEAYHLIGDALRRSPPLSAGFSEKVMARLAEEPVVLAPAAMPGSGRSALRFALPLAASVMGVGVVGWLALSLNAPQPVQMAATPPAAQAAVRPASAQVSQGALKEYLVAHQAHSPSGRLQGVAPYVRTVSEIRQGDRQ